MAAKKTRNDVADDTAPGNATQATTLYHTLKSDIIRGALPPRQWLRIDYLRKRYNVGASPSREALNRLSAEGCPASGRTPPNACSSNHVPIVESATGPVPWKAPATCAAFSSGTGLSKR